MNPFQPPPFRPHRWLPSGHLQTLASLSYRRQADLPTTVHTVTLADGDAVVLHEGCPDRWQPGDPSLLLIHGLCGSHASSYMVRLTSLFHQLGVRVVRMDSRGCGDAFHLARQITHAGRSDDVIAALAWIAERTQSGPIAAAGISLGGNQLLRAVGRIGAGLDVLPTWADRVSRLAAVSPPIDLHRCSERFRRWSVRPYNRYFVRRLLQHVPPQVRRRDDFPDISPRERPRTLMELDERFTAPLSGFASAADYYQSASAAELLRDNPFETLILIANDDPLIPAGCFLDRQRDLPESTRLLIAPRGGHIGYIDDRRRSWMDEVLAAWFGV